MSALNTLREAMRRLDQAISQHHSADRIITLAQAALTTYTQTLQGYLLPDAIILPKSRRVALFTKEQNRLELRILRPSSFNELMRPIDLTTTA